MRRPHIIAARPLKGSTKPPIYTMDFAAARLDVLTPSLAINAYAAGSAYLGTVYGNLDPTFIMSMQSNLAYADPPGVYIQALQDTPNVSYSWHPSAHCFSRPNGSDSWPPCTWVIKDDMSEEDWDLIHNPDYSWDYYGYPSYYVDWDTEAARNRWADGMMTQITEYANILLPYRRLTHIYLDNCHFNVPEFSWENQLLGISRLRAMLNANLSVSLNCNCSAYISSMTLSDMDAISAAMDGVSFEVPWSFAFAEQKWDSTAYGINIGTKYYLDNYRRLLNNNTAVICVSMGTSLPRYSGYATYGWTYNGANPGNSGGTLTSEDWDEDLTDRRDAAMAMITKPTADSRMFVCQRYYRKVGTYGAGGYVGTDPPGTGEWTSKDWGHWPELFGAPTSDYTTDITEDGADVYDTATQIYLDCDIIKLSRTFENGTISVDLTADLSDDVDIRKGAVVATLT